MDLTKKQNNAQFRVVIFSLNENKSKTISILPGKKEISLSRIENAIRNCLSKI